MVDTLGSAKCEMWDGDRELRCFSDYLEANGAPYAYRVKKQV